VVDPSTTGFLLIRPKGVSPGVQKKNWWYVFGKNKKRGACPLFLYIGHSGNKQWYLPRLTFIFAQP